MNNDLKNFKNALKEINVMIKENEVNELVLKEIQDIMQDLNYELNISNANIDKLKKQEKELKTLEQKKYKYKIKGYIYTLLPLFFGLMFSPISFNTLTSAQSVILLCSTVAILSPIASVIGFNEYKSIKKELKKLPKIVNDLCIEYKDNENLKYDLSVYKYKEIELKEEKQKNLKNIQKILDTVIKKEDIKGEFVKKSDVYEQLILNKNNIKIKK